MSELPPGWCWAAIRDVGEVRLGRQRSPDRANGPHMRPYLRAANVTWKGVSTDDVKEMDFSPEEFEVFALRPGDVIVGEASGSRLEVGKSAVWRGEIPGVCFQNTLIRVRASEAILPAYLQKHLAHDALRGALADISKGIGIYHLGAAGLAELKIGLAPLCEQQRIVDKLDDLLARVDACRERLDRVPSILKRFRQAVLAAATSGELTMDWREAHGVDSAWPEVTVAEVVSQVFDGPFGTHLMSKDYVDAGIRVVRLENIAPLRFVEGKRTYITPEKYEGLRKHTLLAGDIILASFMEEDVRVCLLPDELSGMAINKSDSFCVRADALRCRPEFLVLRLACRSTFTALAEGVHGITRPRINLGHLRNLRLSLPTLDEQEEIVRRISNLFELVSRLEERLEFASNSVEHMVVSSLRAAFRGELVPQDPDDEPASELLARFQRDQAKAKPGKATRGRGRAPSVATEVEKTCSNT
jgi:type I restriction enzyme S subunit